MMRWIAHEWRLVGRSRLCLSALALLCLLSAVSLWSGAREVARQQAHIARLAPVHEQDVQAVARRFAKGGDAGYAAYYTFYDTQDPPSGAAFLALGLRDAAPYVLRVRALGLQAQLYEGETFNPELALAGRFDFAFVLVYLAPLFIIALLHDLVSGERQAGRLRMLLAMPNAGTRLWLRRAGLRTALAIASMALPLLLAAALLPIGMPVLAAALTVVVAYAAFWCAVCALVATRPWGSTAHATALMGCWAVLTLVLPTLAQMAIARGIPVEQGVDLMLAQRQNVHGAWDQPRDATMQRFFETHPEWKDTAPLPVQFHWKWYYAFQQLGDESVAPAVSAYRAGLARRQDWTARLGWLLPGVAVQTALHGLAQTDLPAQLRYQEHIEAFHREVRGFYYPYVFNERPFGPEDFAKRPRFAAHRPAAQWPVLPLAACLAWGLFMAALAAHALRRVDPAG